MSALLMKPPPVAWTGRASKELDQASFCNAAVSDRSQRRAPKMNPVATLSAVEAAKRTRQGDIRAVELVDAALEQIAKLDEQLRAFMTVDAEGARRNARRLDALPAEKRGPLHGLPIAFKDLIATAGVRTMPTPRCRA